MFSRKVETPQLLMNSTFATIYRFAYLLVGNNRVAVYRVRIRLLATMELDRPETDEVSKSYLNGPLPKQRMQLATKDEAQMLRQREAEREYGRGKKIQGTPAS